MSEITWLTDRSRYETGTGRCPRQRYLGYHAGPTGYGYVKRGESLPLATGIYTHVGCEELCKVLRDHDRLPTDEDVRAAVALALGQYEKKITDRGFRGLLASESSDFILREQQSLVEGMVWAFRLLILPWLHHEFRLISVEKEEDPYPLGDGSIGLMQRLDVLGERRMTGALAYLDIKTTGRSSDQFAEEWEIKPQLALNTLGCLERYGKEVTELYVIGLNKGYRKKGTDDVTRQESPYCYGYRRPANPPLATEEWLPSYEWIDAQGQTKRAGRDYKKAPTFEYPFGGVEGWVKQLPESVLKKQVFLIGPLIRQNLQVEALARQIAGEEQKWQQTLWQLYEKQQEILAYGEAGMGTGTPVNVQAHPAFLAELDRLVPCSWNCRPFGAKHQCEFVHLCMQQAGWEDPIGSGLYAPRLPHHAPEKLQMSERGLLPEGLEVEEEEG
jgi:hypothetical protein